MTNAELLGRRNEILKRNIGKMLVQENKTGLDNQESMLLQILIKEFHRNEYELNSSKNS